MDKIIYPTVTTTDHTHSDMEEVYYSFYEEFLLINTPRALTQVDRDPDSITFGSCDRNFWHLKIRDFSSAILQQNALAFAVLYNHNFRNNIYYNNPKISGLIYAILEFWKKIQLKDGSFNEYYPNEHAFPPTVFSLFAVSEAYRRLGFKYNDLLLSMEKASRYLSKNYEHQACNQEIASITSLYSFYLNTDEKWVLKTIKKKLGQILDLQSEEGWFYEYGGADLGYLGVSFDMMAEYFFLSKNESVKKPLEKILQFISYFCHPDNTYGGEYGSRNTIYLLPNGPETMIYYKYPLASSIKKFIFNNEACKNFLNSIDDRYISHYILQSFARALEKENLKKEKTLKTEELPCQYDHLKIFPHSGLLTFKKKELYGVLSLKKGGLLKIFKKDSEIFSDYGYRYSCGNYIAVTNWQDDKYEFKIDSLEKIMIQGSFNLVKRQIPSTLKHIILRFLSLIFGRSIISFLKKQLIFMNRHSKANFIRKIKISEREILIEDTINSDGSLKNFHNAPIYSLRHVASSNFFYSSELLDIPKIKISFLETPALITHKIDLNDCTVHIKHEKL